MRMNKDTFVAVAAVRANATVTAIVLQILHIVELKPRYVHGKPYINIEHTSCQNKLYLAIGGL